MGQTFLKMGLKPKEEKEKESPATSEIDGRDAPMSTDRER